MLVGFGYASSTDDYKLVLVSPVKDFGYAVDVNIFIFSMRANSWKLKKVSLWPSGSYRPYAPTHHGTLSNEAIHWVNRDHNYKEFDVCAFDLEKEEFRKVPAPRFNQNDNPHVNRKMQTIDHSGGCLCLWSETFQKRCWYSELWMMRDYGVRNSWMKPFKFRRDVDIRNVLDLDALSFWEPCLVIESGAIVIKVDNKELVRIECHKKKKPVCSGRYRLQEAPGCKHLLGATSYDETLVSLS
ncbi:PREDICTED: F-box protein CPR30-like [Fragaria vesca subsp. vesca]|uniref:F-box protein CPR30-like n=1 Tax=Fragaria vesca subsp. vesca TaxID=101020 RepID=UPI0002C33A1E|nr:PREDICTED: F-box protein CPR30-like [Fragaria vesca subsp. vesca]